MRTRVEAVLALILAGCAAPGPAAAPETARGEAAAPPPAPPPAAPVAVADLAPEPVAAAGPAPEPVPIAGPGASSALFGPAYDEALAAVGLDRRTARCSPNEMALYGVGEFRLPLFEAIEADPTLADRVSSTFRDAVVASAPALEPLGSFAFSRAGAIVRKTLLGDPLEKEEKAAREPGALGKALQDSGATEVPDLAEVPPEVAAAAALVVRAAMRAYPVSRLLRELADAGSAALDAPGASLLLAPDDEDDASRAAFEERARKTDLRALAAGAALVHLAVDRAAERLGKAAAGAGAFEVRCKTVRGIVLLRGTGRDDADGPGEKGPFLLRVDLGGNDRYLAGAATGPLCPVSVLIDVGGDDVYDAPENEAAFGAGAFGIGVCVDLSGNDRYALHGPKSFGLGCGVFGAGALLDRAGDDVYEGDRLCMGAGVCGIGVLADLGGKDRYRAWQYAQGFGFVRGCGVLADLGGDDAYEAVDGPDPETGKARYPSAQSKDHNSNLCQGFGFGVRADYLDGHSLAGGVGLLVDAHGNDTYRCGVFGQGAGYWMGVGMLLDGDGDDRYAGGWYVQGASAHYAVGVLEDAAGNDAYEATMNMAQGAGHDFSVGVLLDRGGDDAHRAPNLSLGAGNDNGVGFFVDAGGDDSYEAAGATLGGANLAIPPETPSLRHGALTLGVFLDLGGTDRYGAGLDFAGDGKRWTLRERRELPKGDDLRGVGVDR